MKQIQSMEALERLNRINRIAMTGKKVERTCLSYDEMEFEADSVIYCDPPYSNTDCRGYTAGMDHQKFYDWCERIGKVYISEYNMPEDRFRCIAEIDKICTISASDNSSWTLERVYTPR